MKKRKRGPNCIVAGQCTPSLEYRIFIDPSAAVTIHEDMPVAEGVAEVVSVKLVEMHVVIVYGQAKYFLLRYANPMKSLAFLLQS